MRIVSDAAVSTRGVFGGRLVPLVILDTSDRPDIDELIRIHHASPQPGDVKIQWAELDGHEGYISLILTFVRPTEATIIVEFNIAKQGILVEQALSGKGMYIQAGRDGDRLTTDPERPKVLMEVPDVGFRKEWDRLFQKYLTKHFRSKGLSRSDAKRAAQSAIGELHRFGSFRMRDSPDSK
ncbi:MAG: hypothetical protein JO108_28490 [Acidobacteriaceae bacterium]|nr:hypothetical protein [Acidobacteriaceae bacterium]